MDRKYAIFHIDGGIGKHIAATAVARCIKNNHPDRELIVVFVNNKPIEIIFMADDNKFNLTDTYDSCN